MAAESKADVGKKAAISTIPAILGLCGLPEATASSIAAEAKAAGKFSADYAVESGKISHETLQTALVKQSFMLADAALSDIAYLTNAGASLTDTKAFTNVTTAKESPSGIDGWSAAANIMRNSVANIAAISDPESRKAAAEMAQPIFARLQAYMKGEEAFPDVTALRPIISADKWLDARISEGTRAEIKATERVDRERITASTEVWKG